MLLCYLPGLPTGNIAFSRLAVQTDVVTDAQPLSSHQLPHRHRHHYVTDADPDWP